MEKKYMSLLNHIIDEFDDLEYEEMLILKEEINKRLNKNIGDKND